MLGIELRSWGTLLKDDAVEEAVYNRTPVVVRSPTAAISRGFTELASRFDRTFVAPERGLTRDFWDQILTQRFSAA